MHINHLSLTNFRNYGRLELTLPTGATLLQGANAQGKTNLLEAIYYLATARSPYADQEAQLINWEADDPEAPVIVGRLVGQITTQAGPHHIEIRLIKEPRSRQISFRREALVDRRKVRLMDLLGTLRVVLFLPQDIQLITGPPAARRRYLDVTLCQTDSIYCRTLSTYNKVLEQRNALLRRLAESSEGRDLLPIYTEKLIKLGSLLFTKRAAFLAHLARETQRIHFEELTGGREAVRLSYLPRLDGDSSAQGDSTAVQLSVDSADWLQEQTDVQAVAHRFERALEVAQENDLARALTSVGPHRDDWRFWVNGRELSSYGSRGQQRTAMLALKMAEIDWMVAETGETPVLLLDEVVAELDEQRRALLLTSVQSASQAILTATDPAMFTESFLNQATTMIVSQGQVRLDSSPGGRPD
jgi:DNA replication and repair protein RecF